VAGSDITFDFTGSDPQVRGFKNSPLANTHAAVFVALLTLVDPGIPKNEGTFRPVRVVTKSGSVVDASEPAAVTYATISPTHEIVHAIWSALAHVIPDRVSAGWGKPNHPISAVLDPAGGYVYYHWGGFPAGGAVRGGDGFDQISTLNTLGGMTIPNVEVYEKLYPIRIERQEFSIDGGGPGEWRGGTGVDYEVVFLDDSELVLRGDSLRDGGGMGANGGLAGQPGRLDLIGSDGLHIPTPQYGLVRVPAGARLSVKSAGGGGWGDASRRAPEAVRRDALAGVVSPSAALRDYGVLLTGQDLRIDAAETERERAARGGSHRAGSRG
jgi:N-methylhydantoinase B